jgi:DNA invertase Pin-like site-specific DNA recombinase
MAKGKRLGRKPGDWKGKRIHVTPEQEATARKLHGEGKGVSFIARAIHVHRPTVYSVIGTAAAAWRRGQWPPRRPCWRP